MSDNPKFSIKDRDDLFRFIAEKAKNVIAPFNHKELCIEYKRESGKPHLESVLNQQLLEGRLRIFQWGKHVNGLGDFDNDTKVKMLFALSAPVDYSFLAELREEAEVEVDEYLRIIKYEKKGEDGFQLSGVHTLQPLLFPCDTDKKMLKLLARISQNRTTPIKYHEFAIVFERWTNSKLTEHAQKYCYKYIRDYIHIATEYDMPTRIRMLFVSGAEIDAFFLGMLRKDAFVEVDYYCRITKYEAHDGNLTLNIDQNSWQENRVEQQHTRMTFEVRKEKKESTSDDLSEERVKNNGINTQTAVGKLKTPAKKQDDVEVKTNSSITRSGRVSKKIYPTTDFFTEEDDDNDQFFRNKRRSNSRKRSSSKPKITVVDDSSPTTSSNIATIGGDVSDDDNQMKISEKKVPVSSSRSCSSSNYENDVEFDAPPNEDNKIAAKTSGVNAKKAAKSAESSPKVQKTPAKKSTVSATSSAQNKGKIDTKTDLAASNTKNEKKDVESSSDSDLGSSSKIDNQESKIVSKEKNRDNVDGDGKKVTKSDNSTPKIQKTPAKKLTVPAISKTENEEKSNIKTMSTPKIDDNKGSKTVENDKNVSNPEPDALKITPKVDNKNRNLRSSASESSESQKDDFIYEGGVPPLPIPFASHKMEEMEYQEDQVDRFVACQSTEFKNSQFLTDYQHHNNVKPEEMDHLEAIRDVNLSLQDNNEEKKNVPMDMNRDRVDAKNATKSVDSTPEIQKIPSEKTTALVMPKTENEAKATSKINNKENTTSQKKKNVVKTAPKTENKKRKAAKSRATTSAKIAKKSVKSEVKSEENQEESDEELIYEGGIAPLPILLEPHKTEEIMEYQEEQVDRFVASEPTEFGNSLFLEDYQHDNDVKLEEMDALEAIRDASFTPVHSTRPDESQIIEMTNSENILKMLRNLVCSMDVPMVQLRESSKKNLREFLAKIDIAIEKMRAEDHKVPIDDMLSILNVSLHIVTRSATTQTTSLEDSASIQGFLWSLRCILITLSIPGFEDFQKTINENIRELDGQDKKVQIERIRRALETILASATS